MSNVNSETKPRFDPKIIEFIPHRPPMLLINKILSVDEQSSKSEVTIDKEASFFEINLGVPACIGLEYMGQTAALIAGYEASKSPSEAKLGFLLGTRKYQSTVSYFKENSILEVECTEGALVGDSLASFNCKIRYQNDPEIIATASLSVLRKPIENSESPDQ